MQIELSTQTWMLLFFLPLLAISIWKIAAFLPNKPLRDDDTTQEATAALEQLMLTTIAKHKGSLDEKELYVAMKSETTFDAKRFWRFNENRLRHMLKLYYLKNPAITSIAQIQKEIQ